MIPEGQIPQRYSDLNTEALRGLLSVERRRAQAAKDAYYTSRIKITAIRKALVSKEEKP